MMKIEFCWKFHAASEKPDEHGLCARHGKPVEGAPMKCIHCMRAETISYGDVCPQCGYPAVGELGEPASILNDDEEVSEDDCGCRMEREDVGGGIVRLFRCKLHYDAVALVNSFDKICQELGCEVDALPAAFEQLNAERSKVLEVLCIDTDLEGEDLKKAVAKADVDYSEASESVDTAEYLLDVVGMTQHELTCDRTYWNPVDFLVSRLRALAPDKLVKELRPKAPRQRRAKKAKAVEEKAPAEEEGPSLWLVKR